MPEILALKGNWRVVKRKFFTETEQDSKLLSIPEMKGPDELWRFPDCGYECIHCNACLGCIRKWIYTDADTLDAFVVINDGGVRCDKSPNGLHEYDLEAI